MCSLESLSGGQDVGERVVIIGGAEGGVGQGGEVSVVPATVQGDGRVALSRIQLVATARSTCRCTTV